MCNTVLKQEHIYIFMKLTSAVSKVPHTESMHTAIKIETTIIY